MKNLNRIHSLTKSVKASKVFKGFYSGFIKLAQIMHIKPNILSVILGLLALLLLALALGINKKEGFTSMDDASLSKQKAIDNMNSAINAVTWSSDSAKSTFKSNVNTFYATKMKYLTQGDTTINSYDLGRPGQPTKPDGLVYELNDYDASINASGYTGYVDNTETNPSDDFTKKYTLTNTVSNPVNISTLTSLQQSITSQINSFSGDGQKNLNSAFAALSKNVDDMYAFMTGAYDATGVQDILSQSDYASDNGGNQASYWSGGGYGYPGGGGGGGSYGSGYGYPSSGSGFGPGGVFYGPGGVVYVPVGGAAASTANTSATANTAATASTASGGVFYGPGGVLYGPISGSASTTTPKTASTTTGGVFYGPGGVLYGPISGSASTTTTAAKTASAATGIASTATGSASTATGSLLLDSNKGITSSNIPASDADLYMLKSRMLPAGPVGTGTGAAGTGSSAAGSSAAGSSAAGSSAAGASSPSPSTCASAPAPVPPCPACERCPEPSFDCKRVPNYNSSENKYLPRPVLADFSQFGM